MNNQVGQLIGTVPGQGTFNLESANANQLPPNVQQTVCGLQLKLYACIKLKYQICNQLGNALSQANNVVPVSNIIPSYMIPSWLTQATTLPSAP